MISQKVLTNNLFSYHYVYKEEEKYGNGYQSDLTLGYFDKTRFVGDIQWYPVIEKSMFGIKLDDILFDGKSYDLCKIKPGGCSLAIDSGLTYMSVPTYMHKVMAEKNLGTTQKCDPARQLGNITLVIGGKHYDMPPSDWQSPPQWKTQIIPAVNATANGTAAVAQKEEKYLEC